MKNLLNNTVRRSRLAAIAAVAALALSGCGGASPAGTSQPEIDFKLANPGKLTVATYGSSPPVIDISADKKLGGITGELLNGFANERGLEVEAFETTFSSALLAVQQGRADVAEFIYHTDERSKSMYYTSSYVNIPVAVITKKDFAYHDPEDLKGKKVGTVLGLVWGSYLQKQFGGDAKLYQSTSEAAQALLNGQIDGYVNGSVQLSNPPLAQVRETLAAHPVKAGEFGFPDNIINNVGYNTVACDNKNLAKAIDEYLGKVQTSGDWDKSYEALNFPTEFRVSKSTEPPAQGC